MLPKSPPPTPRSPPTDAEVTPYAPEVTPTDAEVTPYAPEVTPPTPIRRHTR